MNKYIMLTSKVASFSYEFEKFGDVYPSLVDLRTTDTSIFAALDFLFRLCFPIVDSDLVVYLNCGAISIPFRCQKSHKEVIKNIYSGHQSYALTV